MNPKTLSGQRRRMPTGRLGRFGLGIAGRRVARRLAAVDAYEFPSSVRRRLRLAHPDLGSESVALIEAATRQWFRLLARRPGARLSMPSKAVDDMWHKMVLHTRDYAAFCDAAFGRFLHHEPESAMTSAQAAANRSEHLLATLRLAREDEGCAPGALPLLFRVDQEVGLTNARHYIANCGGGRAQCYDQSSPSLVCLAHLAGLAAPLPGRSRPPGQSRDNASWSAHGCGGAGGFGSSGFGSSGGCGGGCGS